eukprot:TRINITY_DN3908_c0_g3_i1.p2 TRINITY_DN3908_c0_g3~~TRINITY_DN3908_c0_g3_i1.p2  ORF type:complete len:190 (-),score=26.33 TRINITY_DN3908_c0_g3_i1:518-1087(-)
MGALKQLYQTLSKSLNRSTTLGRKTRPKPRRANSDLNVKVVLCPACDGQKVVKEFYGNRVLEHCCDKCEGEGCLKYKHGEQIRDVHRIQRNARKEEPQQDEYQSKSPEKDFKKLSKLIYKYKKEVKELQRKITVNTPEAEEKLIHAVIFEIQKHLDNLESMKLRLTKQEQPVTMDANIIDEHSPTEAEA